MEFASIRIITNDPAALAGFYQEITGITPKIYTEDFLEFPTAGAVLALASKRSMDMFGAGAAKPADNHTAILEFKVDDVDKEYERIKQVVGKFELEPTTQPWGNRSMLFRDPDGNLINFFTPLNRKAG